MRMSSAPVYPEPPKIAAGIIAILLFVSLRASHRLSGRPEIKLPVLF
jgi:hypothetical protein